MKWWPTARFKLEHELDPKKRLLFHLIDNKPYASEAYDQLSVAVQASQCLSVSQATALYFPQNIINKGTYCKLKEEVTCDSFTGIKFVMLSIRLLLCSEHSLTTEDTKPLFSQTTRCGLRLPPLIHPIQNMTCWELAGLQGFCGSQPLLQRLQEMHSGCRLGGKPTPHHPDVCSRSAWYLLACERQSNAWHDRMMVSNCSCIALI